MADCTGGTLVTATVADEYDTATLSGIGSSWSVGFSWYPLSGYLLYPYSATYPTLPIISICTNDSNHINLDWDRQNTQFKMTSSTSSVSLAPSNTINWVSLDCVKFIITCDGTDSTLYVWHPENYSVNNASNGTLSVVGSGINLGSSIPTSLRIGTDNLISNIGNGAYTNIMVWNNVLSVDDINAFFNMKSQSCDGTNHPRFFEQLPAADFVCPDGVDFADYSFFTEHWLNTNCADNNNCDGTDLDLSGTVDFSDLMIFCQQWLEGITQ